MALSLAEIAHRFPLSGGQYHYTFVLSSKRTRSGLSFLTGWLAVAGWIALFATGPSLCSNLIVGLLAFSYGDSGYVALPWHIFVIYVAVAIWAMLLNIYGMKFLPTIDKAALIW